MYNISMRAFRGDAVRLLRRGIILLLACVFTPVAGHCSIPVNVQFTSVSTDAASLSWVLDTPGTEYPLMAISTAPDFSVNFSSTTGALGAQTTTYYGLTPNTTYFFKVKVSTETDYSAAASAITDPNAPVNALIDGVYSSSISVSWSDAGNGPGTIYRVLASLDDAFTAVEGDTLTVAGAYTFEGLELNTTYYIRARTIGFLGAESSDAELGSTITLSALPGTLSYETVYSSGAFLSWDTNGNLPGTKYAVTVSSDDFLTVNYSSGTAVPAFTAYALDPNTTYYFKIASFNSAGTGSGYAVFPSTQTPANVPKLHPSGSFAAATADTVEVRWLQNSNPANTEYYLHVSSSPDHSGPERGSGLWTAWAALVPVASLDAGTTFYFEVKARDTISRETDWLDLGYKKTLPGADLTAPSVIDLQDGDDAWRSAASGFYKVHFSDEESGLSKFEVKLATSPGLTGALPADWTSVVTGINAPDYDLDWQLPASLFQTIPEGVTTYVSVRAYDRAAVPNITVSTDVFYVLRDTTPPGIVNAAVSPSGWQAADPGPFNVDFFDTGSGLAAVQYSVSGAAGTADAAWLGWTDIDTLVSSKTYTRDWSVAFSELTGGATNYISVRARDAAGNTMTLADAFKVLKSAAGPGVTFISPAAVYVSTVMALTGSATGWNENVTVSYVELWVKDLATGKYYDGLSGAFSAGAPVWLGAAGTLAWSLNTSTFGFVDLSSYTAVARARDDLNRYSPVYATSTFTLEQDPPAVTVSSPAALSSVFSLDEVEGSASDAKSGPAGVGISVKRIADGKWWNFYDRGWDTQRSSSFTAVSGGNWSFLPDVYLRGNMLSGYDYFVTAYAFDAAVPANYSAFGLAGSTFTFIDAVPPGQTLQVSASTDPASVAPGRLRLTWVFPGDDGQDGILAAGAFAVEYATVTGFGYSTGSVQVLISTASLLPGSTQVHIISGLANSTSYYLRLWTRDDADSWSSVSPEFSGLSGEGLPNEIAGHVRTATGQGITGVLVEALNASGAAGVTSYTIDDGNGSFALSGLAAGVYRVQATWIEDGMASSVSKDGVPVGYADADFTLSVTYQLASISGRIAGPRPLAWGRTPPPAARSALAVGEAELYQRGRLVAAARAGGNGEFKIGNLLPGDYELKLPDKAPLAVHLRSGENLTLSAPSELLAKDSLYAYPDPARSWVKFHFNTGEPSAAKEITVFNTAGRLIKKIRGDAPGWNGTGNPYEFQWNFSASDPAPGVYFYKLNLKSQTTGKTRVRTGKFAVIR